MLNHFPNRYLLLFLLLLGTLWAQAQTVVYQLNAHIYVDNREFAKSNGPSETIFGARFSPEIGINLQDTSHQFRVGISALHDFGSPKFISQLNPIIYYHYSKPKLQFYMGAFPRVNTLEEYPRALLRGTIRYSRPNIEGLLFKIGSAKSFISTWIDWTSKQTDTQREQFLWGILARQDFGRFFGKMYFNMYHDSFSINHPANEYAQDDGGINAMIGINMADWLHLKEANISLGGMMGLYRIRGISNFKTPKGAMATLHLRYRNFYLDDTYYRGAAQKSIWGDAFYQYKSYNRIDAAWQAIHYKGIDGRLVLSFHQVEHVMDSQQAFQIRYHFAAEQALKK